MSSLWFFFFNYILEPPKNNNGIFFKSKWLVSSILNLDLHHGGALSNNRSVFICISLTESKKPSRRSFRIREIREIFEYGVVGTKEWEVTRVVAHRRFGAFLNLMVAYKVDGSCAWILAKYTRCKRLWKEYNARRKLIGGSKTDKEGTDSPKSKYGFIYKWLHDRSGRLIIFMAFGTFVEKKLTTKQRKQAAKRKIMAAGGEWVVKPGGQGNKSGPVAPIQIE